MKRLHACVTEKEWYDFIKKNYDEGIVIPEINFWRPLDKRRFAAIKPGEVFAFKFRNKHNKLVSLNGEIVGGAYYVRFEYNTISEAWSKYGRGNGAASFEELKILTGVKDNNQVIGCIILKNPFFFSAENWIIWENDPRNGYKCKTFDNSDSSENKVISEFVTRISQLSFNKNEFINALEKELDERNLVGLTREAVVRRRVNQDLFRRMLLNRYSSCCLCGVTMPDCLIASHIKPWSESDRNEKLSEDNGFLMCPNHDKLFDTGLISFSEDGKVLISSKLDAVNRMFMNVEEDKTIDLTDNNKKFLIYHRIHIFQP